MSNLILIEWQKWNWINENIRDDNIILNTLLIILKFEYNIIQKKIHILLQERKNLILLDIRFMIG